MICEDCGRHVPTWEAIWTPDETAYCRACRSPAPLPFPAPPSFPIDLADLRALADDLADLADSALRLSRAIHDAAPDQVPPACLTCKGDRYISPEPWDELNARPCPDCHHKTPPRVETRERWA